MQDKYQFVKEALFFPEERILAVGDLHIGYDSMLKRSGILLPTSQIDSLLERLENIFKKIKAGNGDVKKVIFLGDFKHSFGFDFEEKKGFKKVMEFLSDHGIPEEDIILIKGNHDTIDFSFGKMRNYYIKSGIMFLHGDKSFPEMFGKGIKTLVMGHLHPSIIIEEKPGVKHESYKCFLTGKFKGKETIILPSFLGMVEGTPVNEYREVHSESFSIIPRRDILKFEVHVVGKDNNYDFGEIRRL